MRPAATSSRAANNSAGRSRLPTTSVWAVIIRVSLLRITCCAFDAPRHVIPDTWRIGVTVQHSTNIAPWTQRVPRPLGRIEGCGLELPAPFDTLFRSATASLHSYSGCYVAQVHVQRCATILERRAVELLHHGLI